LQNGAITHTLYLYLHPVLTGISLLAVSFSRLFTRSVM